MTGWVLVEEAPVERVVLRSEGRTLAHVRVDRERPDIGEAFPEIDHAGETGFRLRVPEGLVPYLDELEVAADAGGREIIPIWKIRFSQPQQRRDPAPARKPRSRFGRLAATLPTTDLPRAGEDQPASPDRPSLVFQTSFHVLALMSAYNEVDVVGPVIDHLEANGILTYFIDNGSTDGTLKTVRSRLGRSVIGIESLEPGEDGKVSWRAILARKVVLSKELGADWYIHHDADELRESPWPGIGLRDALRRVDRLGYNAIDFRVLNFPPVDDRFREGDDPRAHFLRWEDPAEYDRIQRKCWKAGASDVVLEDGGHDVRFTGRNLFPLRFLLRHYPIRSQSHGTRKVLQERRHRFADDEIAFGWHRQYAHVGGPDHMFLRNPAELKPFDLDRVRLETVLEDGANAPRGADVDAAEQTRVVDVRGVLDKATERVISGWAIRKDRPDEPAEVELWDGGRMMDRIKADRPRPDLAEAGLGDGSHGGFVMRTPSQVLDGRPHWIWATVAGTAIALNRSPQVLHFSGRPLQAPAAPGTPAREPA